MADHNGVIIVSWVDSTSQAYKVGVKPGMEVQAWNTIPIKRKLESMNVLKYRKAYPLLTDKDIRMILLTRGRPGETAEIYVLTPTGNSRGVRISTR